MCAVVQVPRVIDSSVRYVFKDGEMALSFAARACGEDGGGDEEGGGAVVVERYRGEFSLAGEVDAAKVKPPLVGLCCGFATFVDSLRTM